MTIGPDAPADPTPQAAIELTVALAVAIAAGLPLKARLALLDRWNAVFAAYANDEHIQVVAARHVAALREARHEAKDWFERYLPAFLGQ